MEPVDFERSTFELFAKQLKAMYNLDIDSSQNIQLLGMVTAAEFKQFDFHHAFMDEAGAWFTINSNTTYSGDDIQLWKLNNYLILVRETADSEPTIFGIYARDEE